MSLSPWFEILWLVVLGSSLMSFCILFGKATGNLHWSWTRVGATVTPLFLISSLLIGLLSWIAMQLP